MTPSLKEWRRIAAFGGFASGANLVGTIGVNIAELIIGRMLGFSAVAYYSRAMGLLNIFRMTVQATVLSVALPAFADQYRAGIDMRPDYGRAAALMTGLAWPFYGMLALLAQPVIRLLYGRQWDEAVVIAQIPWRSLLFPSLFGTCGWLAGAFLLDHPIRREIMVAGVGIARWMRVARI
jgi:O-antigen/teichoic acid export membrane protein